ncbi:hypothetical protein HY249_00780 [Candidatus Azambacteria bacterium]|nr:hypothetical protein [Candidatus Azambacteria bacterium]
MITINLLPEEYKKEYNLEKARRFSVFVFLSLYFIILIFIALLFGADIFLKTEMKYWVDNIENEKSTEKVKQVLGLEDNIKVANDKISIIQKAQEEHINAFEVLLSVSPLISDSVYLQNLTINSDLKKVSMSGFSLTRDEVLKLEGLLKSDAFVRKDSVASPRSNILKKSDIDFSFSFDLK